MSDRSSESDDSSEDITLDELFESFCKVGDRKAESIALRNVDKWFRQANIFSKKITPTDTGIIFSKISRMRKRLSLDQFRDMLNELAEEKDIDVSELESQLEAAGKPSYSGITKPIRGSIAARNMERLTDTLRYTGSSKERFDESGKGLGLAGRYDVSSADGYVQGYKRSGEDLDEQQNKAEKKKSSEEHQTERRKSEQPMNQAERRKSREEQQMREVGRRKSREDQPMGEAEKKRSREEQPVKVAGKRSSREEQPVREAGIKGSREVQPMREGRKGSREEQRMGQRERQKIREEQQSSEEQPLKEAGKKRSREEQPIREAGKIMSRDEQPMRAAGKRESREEDQMGEEKDEEESD